MHRTLLVALLALPLAAGCAGDDGVSRSNRHETRQRPGTSETFAGDTQAFMADGLRQFSRGDPEWPKTRARWLSLGEDESEFLVTSMFAALIKAQRMHATDLVDGARDELVAIGPRAAPFLADVLAVGTVRTVYDEVNEREVPVRVDDDARREASNVLARIGAPAAPAVASALSRAETKSGRRFALLALGDMGEGGGAAARDALVRWSRDSDWVLRVEAVHGLRNLRDDVSRRTLEAALSDDESLVRQKAAEALAERGEPAAVPALRSAREAARGKGRVVESERLAKAIALIEGGR